MQVWYPFPVLIFTHLPFVDSPFPNPTKVQRLPEAAPRLSSTKALRRGQSCCLAAGAAHSKQNPCHGTVSGVCVASFLTETLEEGGGPTEVQRSQDSSVVPEAGDPLQPSRLSPNFQNS